MTRKKKNSEDRDRIGSDLRRRSASSGGQLFSDAQEPLMDRYVRDDEAGERKP